MSVKQLVTADELWGMPEVPGKWFELIDRELVAVPGATLLQGLIAAIVYELIQRVVRERNLGLVVNDGVAYILRRDPDLVRIPDVSFLAWNNVPRELNLERYGDGAPTLAVEKVSPDDRASEHRERPATILMRGFVKCGCCGRDFVRSPSTPFVQPESWKQTTSFAVRVCSPVFTPPSAHSSRSPHDRSE